MSLIITNPCGRQSEQAIMLPFPLVYSPRYDLNLGDHVFPAIKYRLLHDLLLEEQIALPEDFVEPAPITDDDARLVHTAEWVDKLRHGRLSLSEVMRLEIPYSSKMVDSMMLMCGGSLLAAQHALDPGGAGFGFNIGGGFHHAFAGHGEGFCPLHDFGIAIRKLQAGNRIRTAMTIDLDVHHGNGTAAIFAGDPTVFTLSLHQRDNYPAEKPPSSLDVNLENNTLDRDYLAQLAGALEKAFAEFSPDLIFYVAGADPYMEDQLGGLLLTIGGLRDRDRMVYDAAAKRGIPIATVLAGGYAAKTQDTVTIHANTVRMAAHEAHARAV